MADGGRGVGGDRAGGSAAPGPLASDDAYGKYFTDSYERHVAWTRKEYGSIARDRDSAEDLVAEAFKKVYETRANVTNPDAAIKERIRGLALDKSERMERSINDTSVVERAEGCSDEGPAVDAAYASQECRELFSAEAVATLNPGERRIYDLFLEEKTHEEIAQMVGRTYKQVRNDLRDIKVKLFNAMAKLVTLDNVSLDKESARLSSPQEAQEAIGRLPRILCAIVRLTYVENLGPSQIALRLKLASADEVSRGLQRALVALERMYRAKMPDALLSAMTRPRPEGSSRKDR